MSTVALAADPPPTPTFTWGGYLEAVGLLFLLLAVLCLVLWCVRRFGKFSFLPRPGSLPRDALVMEAQMPIGPRKGLMVIRFLGQRLLLGVTEHQITVLSQTGADSGSDGTDDRKADHGPNKHADFQQMVEQASQRADSPASTPVSA